MLHFISIAIKFLICCSIIVSDQVFANNISIVSYNILSPYYLENGGYDKLPYNIIDWNLRKKRILKKLINTKADIICLQEINFKGFKYFKKKLEEIGYKGLYGINPIKDNDSVATFFLADKLYYKSHSIYSYPNTHKVFLSITFNNDAPITVINTKFKWDSETKSLENHRGFQQTNYLIKNINTNTTSNNIILCGDFNMTSKQNHFSLLKKHFNNIYENTEFFTFQEKSGPKQIDHILISKGLEGKPIFSLNDQKQLENLPSIKTPSDHLMIGAIININKNGKKDLDEHILTN